MRVVKAPVSTDADPKFDVVLQHIERYHLTVLEAVAGLPVLAGQRPQQAQSLLRQLEHRAWIASAPLHQGISYWHLLPAGARRLGVNADHCGPLTESAKIRAYALLRFCCLSGKFRVRLTRQDFATRLPEFDRIGLPNTYYFDPIGHGRLGIARVDAGHHGRWDRIVQTIRQDVAAHFRRPAWRQLIAAGRFEFTLLTVFPEKAQRIRASLAQHPDVGRAIVNVVALPELLPLITSMP